MTRVWSSICTTVLPVGVVLSVVLLTVGPFDPDVSGRRAATDRAPAAEDAFLQDLQDWSTDGRVLLAFGRADCDVWRQGVLPVGQPAATMGQDVADPRAEAIADAARQHLCPELR